MNPANFFAFWMLLQTPDAGIVENNDSITTWTCEDVDVDGRAGVRCEFIWTPPPGETTDDGGQ